MKKYKVKSVEKRRYSIARLMNNKPSTYDFVVFDEIQLRAIGLNSSGPAIFTEIDKAKLLSDKLEEGRAIYGFDVIHLDGDVYRLESQLEMQLGVK